jgi:uncharacterized membrane protein YgcG
LEWTAGVAEKRFPIGQGIAGWVAEHGKSIHSANIRHDHRFHHLFVGDKKSPIPADLESVLCMPVKDLDGRILAVVKLTNKHPSKSMSESFLFGREVTPVVVSPKATQSPSGMKRYDGARLPVPRKVVPSFVAAPQFSPFTMRDRQMLSSMCAQIRSTIRRCLTDALLQLPAQLEQGDGGDGGGQNANGSGNLDDLAKLEDGGGYREAISSLVDLYTTSAVVESRQHAAKGIHAMMNRANKLRQAANKFPMSPRAAARQAELPEHELDPNAIGYQMVNDRSRFIFTWPDSSITAAVSVAQQLKIDQLQSVDFNCWDYSDDQLLLFIVVIFKDMGLIDEYNIPIDTMREFCLAVRAGYRQNPFHNFKHGFSVLQFCYTALRVSEATSKLTSLDVLALMVAALCHDIDHPGNTNSFEIASQSSRALTHNDIHVLENHHAHQTFMLLRQSEYGIFQHLERAVQKQLRTIMVQAILATDLTMHFEDTKKLGALESFEASIDASKAPDRQLLVDIFIHTSDLSGQVYPIHVALEWEKRISAEFAMQAANERKLALPVAPFMENLDNFPHRAKLQVGFIEFVLSPWWINIARVFPTLKYCYSQLQENKAFYALLSKKGEQEAEAAAAATISPKEKKERAVDAAGDKGESSAAGGSGSGSGGSSGSGNNSGDGNSGDGGDGNNDSDGDEAELDVLPSPMRLSLIRDASREGLSASAIAHKLEDTRMELKRTHSPPAGSGSGSSRSCSTSSSSGNSSSGGGNERKGKEKK